MRKLKNEELNRLSIEEFRNVAKNNLILLLDDVRSMHNVGSAFRTADAFRLEKIILTGITGRPPHREIHKTALGATESVEWEYYSNPVDPLKQLRKKQYRIVAVEQADESTALNSFIPDKNSRYVLVFGNEVSGVKEDIILMADHVVEIPQFGTKHSLNISVSIGIAVWHMISGILGGSGH